MEQQRRLAYLQAMDIQAWQLRHAPAVVDGAVDDPADAARDNVPAQAAGAATGTNIPTADRDKGRQDGQDTDHEDKAAAKSVDSIAALQAQLADCALCPDLPALRSHTVFGHGNPAAHVLAVVDGPGLLPQSAPAAGEGGEDEQHAAVRLLKDLIRAAGFAPDGIFIAPLDRCALPAAQAFTDAQLATCLPWLQAQIALQQPIMLLAVGARVAEFLLGENLPADGVYDRLLQLDGVPLIVLPAPETLLGSPAAKRAAWDSLHRVLQQRQEAGE